MIPFVPPSCCVYDIEGNYIDLDQCQTFMLGPPGRVSGGETNTALFYDVSSAGSPVTSTRFSLVPPSAPVSNISLKLSRSILLAIRRQMFSTFNGLFTHTETDAGSDPYPEGFPPDWSVATVVP